MKRKHSLYLAGPLCFYRDGYTMWHANRKEAEFNGFDVTMPSDTKLVEEGEKVSKVEMASRIFRNTIDQMNKTDGIIVVDLCDQPGYESADQIARTGA